MSLLLDNQLLMGSGGVSFWTFHILAPEAQSQHSIHDDVE